MVQEQGEVCAVFLCCDSPLPHVEEYYDALGEEYFPTIHPVPQPAEVSTGTAESRARHGVAPTKATQTAQESPVETAIEPIKTDERGSTFVPSMSLKLRRSRLTQGKAGSARAPRLKRPEREHV